jgi:hypothetical protein
MHLDFRDACRHTADLQLIAGTLIRIPSTIALPARSKNGQNCRAGS